VDVARRSCARAPRDLPASLGSTFIGTWILAGLFNSNDNEDLDDESDEDNEEEDDNEADEAEESDNEDEDADEDVDDDQPLLVLRCYAPEGTPIQGREYPVGRQGATLGRKAQNTISFSHTVKQQQPQHSSVVAPQQHPLADGSTINAITNANNNANKANYNIVESIVGIDSSISGEHATIMWNAKTQQLELQDGARQPNGGNGMRRSQTTNATGATTTTTGSTNGTWVRLSGMHEESSPFVLEHSATEILIGTVRFLVTTDDAIVERDHY
jgi:hypothetical protein